MIFAGLRRERLTDAAPAASARSRSLWMRRVSAAWSVASCAARASGLARRTASKPSADSFMTSAASATVVVELLLVARAQREVLEAVALELARVGVAQDLDGGRLGG